ncbi:MAG: MarC family protein [Candidatus Methanosuratincola sp.]|jgi:multiple antibiotic resistance protein|nr:MarC family protein [Candidatus Methanosuratincola sp.]
MVDALWIYLQGFLTLFIIFDPIGNVPLFHAFTSSFEAQKKIKILNDSVKVAFVILVVFAVIGTYILDFFTISMNDFKIAGGVLLFIMSIEGLLGKEEGRWMNREDVAIVPLATPLMAGPGSIYTVMYLMQPPNGPLVAFFAIVANVILQWALLRSSNRLMKILGRAGSTIISRIMAFILSAIAIGMIRSGLVGAYLGG